MRAHAWARVHACARVGAGAQAWVSVRLCSLPTPTCHVPPYCHLWSFWLHHIFRHYPIKDTIFGKLVNTKCVFWFSVHFLFETFLILRRIQQGTVIKVKPFLCKLRVIFVGCKWNLNFFFEKSSNIKFHQNLSSGSQVVPCRQMDRQAGMTKLTAAFHNLVEVSKSGSIFGDVACFCMEVVGM